MLHPYRLARVFVAVALLPWCVRAQTSPTPQLENPDFETGDVGEPPPGWRVPAALQGGSYSVTLTETEPASGRLCVLITKGGGEPKPNAFGNLLQSIDATPFRGKRVRFRAAVRADVSGRANTAALWLRVDRESAGGGSPAQGFFDNMAERPITSKTWSHYEIIGDVEADAAKIFVGCMLLGAGSVWFDHASLDVLGEAEAAVAEPSRELTAQGLINVVAFTRLLGYVRYFHPSDEAAATNWEAFAAAGLRAIEGAPDSDALARQLTSLFAPIAPSVRIGRETTSPGAVLPPAEGRVMTWKHVGLGMGGRGPSIYSSNRIAQSLPAASTEKDFARLTPFTASLGGGITCTISLAVSVDDQGTLPRQATSSLPSSTAMPAPTRSSASPEDRTTRLAAVALAWNALQHSYPYFELKSTDWTAELSAACQRAATDADGLAFLGTLRRLIAALHDGHGNANFRGDNRISVPGFRADWVENKLLLTDVLAGSAREVGLAPGDAIIAIDGKPTNERLADAEAQISGATAQWIRYRATRDMFTGPRDSTLTLEIEPYAKPGERTTVTVTRDSAIGQIMKRSSATLAEIEPGIFYLDLDRLTTAEFLAALPKLEQARGLVFDMRGYPSQLGAMQFFPHLTQTLLTSAQWHTPHPARPDRTEMNFIRGGEWKIQPKEPFLAAKRAFITDGRAISYAESCMGIVEHYKLGAIVGGPTAGTNGNINTMTLPGGYSIVWTGMKVLKHDGSQHHGIGIVPTVPALRTRAGVAAGRDELLERAIEAVKSE